MQLDLNKRTVPVNSMVSIEIMTMGHMRRKGSISSDCANKIKFTLQQRNLLGYNETPHFVSYLNNKRSFVASTTNGTNYHIRATFSNNFCWIYEMHRRIGQDRCCARAHATGEGLPDESMILAHAHAHSVFSSASLIPCQKCFLQHKDDPYTYIGQVISHNRLNLTVDEVTNRQIVTSRVMAELISGSTPMCEELVGDERFVVACSELRQIVRSIERTIHEVKQLADMIIKKTDDNAADEWVSEAPLKGIVPRDLFTNNFCRSLMSSIIKLEESISRLDVTKSSYDEIHATQEYIVTIRRSLQSFEFSYNLTH